MSISSEQIEAIARLARLDLGATDIPNLSADLNRILSFVQQMDSADTQDIEPLSSPVDQTGNLRPDIVTEASEREKFQAIAPEVENGHYLVPKVID